MNVSAVRAVIAKVSSICIAGIILFVYYTNLPLWMDSYLGVTKTPIFFISLVGVAGLSAIAYFRTIPAFFRTDYAKWCTAILIVYAANYGRLSVTGFEGLELDEGLETIKYFLLAPAIAYLIYVSPPRIFPPFLKLLSILVPLLLIVDFAAPDLLRSGQEKNVDQLLTKSRVVGTWFNPNAAAEAVLLVLILVRNYFSKISMAIVYTLAGLALVFAGSRSGLTAYGIVGVYLLFKGRLPVLYIIVPILFALFFTTMLTYFEDFASFLGRESGIADSIARLEFLAGEGAEDESGRSRSSAVTYALAETLERPFIGHGFNYVDKVLEIGPHNLLVDWLYGYGAVGLFMWLGMVSVLYKAKPTQRLINIELFIFVWYTMFTHNLAESNYWFIFFALTAYVTYRRHDINHHGGEVSYAAYKPRRRSKRRRKRRKSST